jgi:preprotein translocase subunit SecG
MLLFAIVIILVSVVLGLIVLIQNPKGGGLSGTFGGVGNQLMGVKQTTDVLEKGTWIFAGLLAVICVISPAFIPKNAGVSNKSTEILEKTSGAPAPAKTAPQTNLPGAAVPADTNKK